MAIPAVKVNRETRAPIVFGSYPNINGDPITDFDIAGTGTEEWLILDVPVDPNNIIYDSRYYHLVETITATPGDEHPLYPGVGRYLKTYTTPKRPIENILNEVENAENDANEQAWPLPKQFKVLAIATRSAYKKAIGLNLGTIEQAAFDLMNDYTAKLIDNYANAQALKTQIEADYEPDLDSGWTTE